ncbi:hypothetical protein [Cellulomonas citrea]|uniref:SLAC1 family transporter n=1 Tax=Cellulomonas citrea TaxID=1909423 RepID=UPI001356A0FB|nr:hypothetical protein [Cellulomonas citrea]
MSEPTPSPAPAPSGTDPAAPPPPAPDRLRDLHPGWFAAVMGTGILAVALANNPGDLPALVGVTRGASIALAVLAYTLAAVLTVAFVARWLAHPTAALADLRHPMVGGLHATAPGGLLVLAVMTSVVGPHLMAAGAVVATTAVLAAVGTTLALLVAVAFGYTLVAGERPAAATNGSWFIPPVVTVIVPMAIAPLLGHVGPQVARLLLFVGYAFLGMGFLLFLLTLGLLHDRLVEHPLPPAPLAPSLWIALGPVGVSALAPLALARAGQAVLGPAAGTVLTLSLLVASCVWGFGLWWLALATSLLVRYLRAGGIPFHVGWWGFVFPLGAYAVATLTLARAWGLPAVEGLGVVLVLALAAAWGTVMVRTVAGLRTGRLWAR